MRPTIARRVLTITAAGVLGLAGCAGADTDTDERASDLEDGTTLTETSHLADDTTVLGAPSLDPEDPENPEQPEQPAPDPTAPPAEQPEEPPTDPTAPPADEELPMEPVGSEVTIAGEPATVCIYGDGWGTNIWAGNANTSCEFVSATHETVVEGLNATTQNIRDYLPPEVQVTSPVTGETYDMTCAPRGERLVSCTGGDGAEVFFY